MQHPRFTVALCPFLFAGSGILGTSTLGADDDLDAFLKAELAKRHIPALSVTVLKDGEVVKTAACGLADVELDVPATPDTVFQIQSITKTFTSAAILMLLEEGKLSLDDPVGKHLEGAPDSWKEIALRHLLSHTSGIKDFINEPTASLRIDVTEEEVLKATAPRPLNFSPGEKYAYSNTNYHLLAMIIRKLSGMWYGDFLKMRIFEPLGMAHTRVVSLSELIPHRASGYRWENGGFRRGEFVAESILGYGGGGIVSTAPDMAKWAAAVLSGKVLKEATIAEAWKPTALKGGGTSGYGLGWGIGIIDGHREIGHSGGHITGFSTQLALYPEDRLAVVVLANANGVNVGRIARRVAGLYVTALAPKLQAQTPIEDRDPAVTALFREIAAGVADWKLGPEKFTPEMWKVLEGQRFALQLMAKGLGSVQSVDLLSRNEGNGFRTFRYRVTFQGGPRIIQMTLDSAGKIAGIMTDDE
jgi:D-alanyl-D-alanine carboxypeptidase